MSNLLSRLPHPADPGGRHHLATVPNGRLAATPNHVLPGSGLTDRATSLFRVIRGQADGGRQ